MLLIGTYTTVYLSNSKPRYNDASTAICFESLGQGLQYAIVRDHIHPSFCLTRLGGPSQLVYSPHELLDTHCPLGARSGAGLDCREAAVLGRGQAPPAQSEDSVDSLAVFLEA